MTTKNGYPVCIDCGERIIYDLPFHGRCSKCNITHKRNELIDSLNKIELDKEIEDI